MHPSKLQLANPPDPNQDRFLRTMAEDNHYDQLVSTSTRIVRADGTTLAVLLKRAIGKAQGLAMYQAIRNRISFTDNRPTASGGTKAPKVTKRGTVDKQTRSVTNVQSSIMGYFDRNPRFPYCRKTAFAAQHPQALAACYPALQQASQLFAQHAPQQYARQAAVVQKTHPDFVLPGTVFTTVTLNRNFRTTYHRDAGDFAEGFGVMSYYRGGRFNGGHLVFPAYRVALQLDSLDLVLFDAHEIHGNTTIVPLRPDWERITCVHYYRENMIYCGSAEDELELVKSHDPRKASRNMKQAARRHIEC